MAKNKLTPIEEFDDALNDILKKYDTEVITELKLATKQFGKDGTKYLKQISKETVGRHSRRRTYYTQWTHTIVEETQTGVNLVFHNRKYQLPHLLEYPHVVGRNRGGRFSGRPHIKKAEEVLTQKYINLLEKKL